MSKKICIIGGGASGVTSAKACKEEGHDYVIFEVDSSFGGLWRYREDDINGLGSVANSTIINSSKEMSAFSDFPPDPSYPNYMHNTKFHQYILDYAKHVGCFEKTKFQHKVINVSKADSFDQDGRWDVEVMDLLTKRTSKDTYDGVMVCTGHHVTPLIPTFAGQEKFKGEILHSHSYKKPEPFAGKRVVIIGIGNSGGDMAVELSYHCPKVYLSTRRGAWVTHRVGPYGKPFDTMFLRRWVNFLYNNFPSKVVNTVAEEFINTHFDHTLYHIKPKHRIFEQHIMVNDALPNRLMAGTMEMRNNVERLTENGVIFEGESTETPCDVILLGTGYKVDFPFIDNSLVPVIDNKVDLYKYVFSPNLQPFPHTLAFVALAQPIGALFPIAELHARWFALCMSGKRELPSHEAMLKDIEKKHKKNAKRYPNTPRNTLQVDWVNYMDELSDLVDCRPKMTRMFFEDFRLWFHLAFGPCVPYQYRLRGPHKWSGARDAILTLQERIWHPMHVRKFTDRDGKILQSELGEETVKRHGYKKLD